MTAPITPSQGGGKYVLVEPFEIYHDGNQIADKDGHICSAESPEIAEAIIAQLNSHAALKARIEELETALRDAIDGLIATHDDETEVELLPRLRSTLASKGGVK